MSKTAYKFIPEIQNDSCMGCGLCAKACPPACLEMVWDFATLTRPQECTSCAECERVCPHGVIQMDWKWSTGSPLVGQWRDEPPVAEAPVKRHWWDALLGETA